MKGEGCLTTNHGEEHLETLHCLEGMRHTCRHDEHFASLRMMHHTTHGDFCLTIEDGHCGIKWSCVLRKSLTSIEGKERECTGIVAEDFARNYTTLCVLHGVGR